MKIETQLDLGDKVLLVSHKIKGSVNSIWVNRSSGAETVMYEVEWKDKNDVLQYRYFKIDELRKIK